MTQRPALVAVVIAAAACWSAVAGAAADGSPTPGVDVSSLLRLTLGLAVVVAAIFAVSWFLRRMGGVSSGVGGQMRVLGGLSVGNRERVVLVQVGDTQLLLGVAPGRVQTLHVLEQPLTPATGGEGATGQASPFAERLQRLMKQRER